MPHAHVSLPVVARRASKESHPPCRTAFAFGSNVGWDATSHSSTSGAVTGDTTAYGFAIGLGAATWTSGGTSSWCTAIAHPSSELLPHAADSVDPDPVVELQPLDALEPEGVATEMSDCST